MVVDVVELVWDKLEVVELVEGVELEDDVVDVAVVSVELGADVDEVVGVVTTEVLGVVVVVCCTEA